MRLSHFDLKNTHTTKSSWDFLLLVWRHSRCCQLQNIIWLTDVCLIQSFLGTVLMLENVPSIHTDLFGHKHLNQERIRFFWSKHHSWNSLRCYTNEILRMSRLPLLCWTLVILQLEWLDKMIHLQPSILVTIVLLEVIQKHEVLNTRTFFLCSIVSLISKG
jgi:hypothetical protein